MLAAPLGLLLLGLAATTSAQAADEPRRLSPPPLVQLEAGVDTVLLNIGSNIDPVKPPTGMANVAVLAFEPLLEAVARIPPTPRLHVIPAAVSDRTGIATLHVYNHFGVSSSLAAAAGPMEWNWNASRGDGRTVLIPTLSLGDVLASLPPAQYHIPYIKTDMQGYDFIAVSSAAEELRRRSVRYLKTEVCMQNSHGYVGVSRVGVTGDGQGGALLDRAAGGTGSTLGAGGVDSDSDSGVVLLPNDLCRHWLPTMRRLGYRLHHLDVQPEIFFDIDGFCANDLRWNDAPLAAATEVDAYWVYWGDVEGDAVLHVPLPPVLYEDWPVFTHYQLPYTLLPVL